VQRFSVPVIALSDEYPEQSRFAVVLQVQASSALTIA
jgi:hypothetical protein